MKTIRLLGITILTVIICGLMTACSSNEAEDNNEANSLIGTWWIYDGDGNYTEITFREDMTCIYKEYEGETDRINLLDFGRYMIDNHDLFIWWENEDEVYHDTFVINGNKMTTEDGVWTRK